MYVLHGFGVFCPVLAVFPFLNVIISIYTPEQHSSTAKSFFHFSNFSIFSVFYLKIASIITFYFLDFAVLFSLIGSESWQLLKQCLYPFLGILGAIF